MSVPRKTTVSVAATCVLLLAPAAATASASVDETTNAGRASLSTKSAPPTPRAYKNLATSYCLDSNAAGRVYTSGCNNKQKSQKWHPYEQKASVHGRNVYVFKNARTGRCLDSNADRKVYTLRCNGGSYQKWRMSTSGGYRVFQNLATSFVLDSNTARQVYTHAYNGGSFQKWIRR